MTLLRELDSIYHLSYKDTDKTLIGKGISRGSEIVTEEGDSIKAGKFPVLFYANVNLKTKGKEKHRINRAGYDLTRLQKRVTALHSNKNKSNSNDQSRSTSRTSK